jgi:hypothetical protein
MKEQTQLEKFLSDPANQIVQVRTGRNEYSLTTRASVLEELAKSVDPSSARNGAIFAGNLTKSILFILPDEAFILSNCSYLDGTPIFAGVVGAQEERQEVWQLMRASGASGRRVYVFKDEATGLAEVNRKSELHDYWAQKRQRA